MSALQFDKKVNSIHIVMLGMELANRLGLVNDDEVEGLSKRFGILGTTNEVIIRDALAICNLVGDILGEHRSGRHFIEEDVQLLALKRSR